MTDGARIHVEVQAGVPPSAETFVIDPDHSEVGFSVRHMLTRAHGKFRRFRGNIELDRAAPERSLVEFVVEAASIDSGHEERDAHLRSGDFLDVANHPKITFRSDRIQQLSYYRYFVTGNLVLRGVTQTLTLLVTFEGVARDPWGAERAGFSTETELNRRDFGMTWNVALDRGGFVLGELVRMTIDVEAIHRRRADAA